MNSHQSDSESINLQTTQTKMVSSDDLFEKKQAEEKDDLVRFIKVTKQDSQFSQNHRQKVQSKQRLICQVNYCSQTTLSSQKHYYKIDGQIKNRHVTQVIIKQKMQKYLRPQIQQKIIVKSSYSSQKQNEDRERRRQRYYDHLQHDMRRKINKCRRCGKFGHQISKCLQEKKSIKCYNCLQNHHWISCLSSAYCTRCGDPKHIQYQCDTIKILVCKRCKKKGHRENICGIIMLTRQEQEDLDVKYSSKQSKKDLSNLRCLNNCEKQYGHFRCKSVDHKTQRPYFRQSEEKEIKKNQSEASLLLQKEQQ